MPEPNPNIYDNLTGIALSNRAALILSTIGFASLGLALYFLILRPFGDDGNGDRDGHGGGRAGRRDGNNNLAADNYGEILNQSDVATLNRAQRRARAKFRMKKARRAAPEQQGGAGAGAAIDGDGEGGDADQENVIVPGGAADARLPPMGEDHEDVAKATATAMTRKERQRAAKAMEKEERKQYAEEARLRREEESKSKFAKAKGEKTNEIMMMESSSSLSQSQKIKMQEMELESIFPRRAPKNENYPEDEGEDDYLSEHLFYNSIIANIKSNMQSFSNNAMDDNSTPAINNQIESWHTKKKMTIRTFLHHLKTLQSISIADLAEEFGISIPDTLKELEELNQRIGIVGIHDGRGRFVYVSEGMIREAVEVGRREERVICPDYLVARAVC